MLNIQSAKRSSGQHDLLSDIALTMQPGEFVSVLGPTGSGKTSLLRLIMGLDLLDAGEISFDSTLLARAGKNLVPPEKRGFSLVFEKTDLLPFWNVEKNILVGKKASRERLAELMALLELQDLRERPVAGLSGGEQQRVALARSLYLQPKLLLLDEPFRNIDRPSRDRLIPALKEYLSVHKTAAILVTHDRDEAFRFSQRIFLLLNGRLVRGDTPEQLYQHPGDEWDARLLGECNLLSVEAAREWLDFQPAGESTTRILVRPEHLEVDTRPPHNASLLEVRFGGFYRTLVFGLPDETRLKVHVLGQGEYPTGERYRIRLKDPGFAQELGGQEA